MGRKMSEETKRKISETKKRQFLEAEQFFQALDTKQCSGCKEYKSIEHFYQKRVKLKSRIVYRPSPRCKPCERQRAREWRKSLTPEQRKDLYRRSDQSRDRDRRKQYQREWQAMKRRRDGMKVVGPWKCYREDNLELLPLEPFVNWLVNECSITYSELARRIGVSDRRFRRFLLGYEVKGGKQYEVKNVSLDFVDQCLIAEGRSMLFDLYPELYESLAA